MTSNEPVEPVELEPESVDPVPLDPQQVVKAAALWLRADTSVGEPSFRDAAYRCLIKYADDIYGQD